LRKDGSLAGSIAASGQEGPAPPLHGGRQ
jgi:hypothetical protein